jgi:hypothetical protein
VAAALKDVYRASTPPPARPRSPPSRRGPGAGVSGDQPELAPSLGRGRAVLRLPGRGPAAVVHHERHRGAQLQAAASGTRQGSLPDRRGRPEAASPGLEPGREEWRMPPREWAMAKAQFAVLFGERFTEALAG